MKIKSLYDKKEKKFFHIKNNKIEYLEIPKIFKKDFSFSFSKYPAELRDYLTEYCIIRYMKISLVGQKPINVKKIPKNKFKITDYYLIQDNLHLGLQEIKDLYFPHIANARCLASFCYRMKKQLNK